MRRNRICVYLLDFLDPASRAGNDLVWTKEYN
jgi:hypothetical protein